MCAPLFSAPALDDAGTDYSVRMPLACRGLSGEDRYISIQFTLCAPRSLARFMIICYIEIYNIYHNQFRLSFNRTPNCLLFM